jgi:Right handed beta helix region
MLLPPSGLLLAAAVLLAGTAPGRVRRVPSEYRTIQEAIDSAIPGDTVLVAPGRYQENIRFRGKGILLASEYLLRHDPALIQRTVIDGSRPAHPDTGTVVLFVEQEDTSAILLGFTITGGTGTVWTDARDKTLYREGGGILCELSAPRIEHNLIERNAAVDVAEGVLSAGGGGIRCGYAEPVIRNNVIRGNRGHYGAGIVLFHSAATVENNLVVDNTGGAGFGGSGLWVVGRLSYRLSNRIEQNTIGRNVAAFPDTTPGQLAGKGGGLTIYGPAVVRNNIIWGNRQAAGGPVDQSARRPPSLLFNLIQGGGAGPGILDREPLFADTVRYYLAPGSPAIDAGDPSSPPDPAKGSRATEPARGRSRADLGAYGGRGSSVLLP